MAEWYLPTKNGAADRYGFKDTMTYNSINSAGTSANITVSVWGGAKYGGYGSHGSTANVVYLLNGTTVISTNTIYTSAMGHNSDTSSKFYWETTTHPTSGTSTGTVKQSDGLFGTWTGDVSISGGAATIYLKHAFLRGSATSTYSPAETGSTQRDSLSITSRKITYDVHSGTPARSAQYVKPGNSTTLAASVSWTNGSGSLTHTFNANGGTPTTTKSTTLTYVYTFNGWHESSTTGTNHSAGSSGTPSGNVTLHAGGNTATTYGGLSFPSNPTWATSTSTATRTVTLNANGGAVTSTQLNSTQTTTITHTFNNGWTAASGGTQVNTSTKPTTGTTYYAHGNTTTTTGNGTAVTLPTPTYTTSTSTKNITITYNGNGGTISPTSTTRTVTTNTTHTFNGGHEGSATGTNHNAGSYTPSGNITLVASGNHSTVTTTTTLGTIPTSGTKTGSTSTATRTITFNANGGTVSPTSRNSTQTTTITYPFDGMYTAASGGSKISTSTATNANTTYYAHGTTSTSTGAGTSVALPTPTGSIHKTTGGYTASSGGTKRGDANGSYTPTTAETLYAQGVSGLHANVSGTGKPATAAYVKVDGTGKTATAVWIKVSGTGTKL